MEALDILNEVNEQINRSKVYGYSMEVHFNKAYQTRIEKAIEELEDLQNENKVIIKTLEKINKEIDGLEQSNQYLLNIVIEVQKVIKNGKLELLKDVIKEEFDL